MSRGPGKLQAKILQFLAEAEGKGTMTIETMRWSLHDSMGMPPLRTDEALPTRWNTSFARAAKTLAEERGSIRIEPRPLESFQECVEHYPGKTLNAGTRSLRMALLPTLQEWTQDKRGIGPKYGVAENEEFLLRHRHESELAEIGNRWLGIEEQLRRVYGNATEGSDDLLCLICRGSALFRGSRIEVHWALSQLIERVCHWNLVSDILKNELRDFQSLFLPENTAHALRLKSFIHQFADVPNTGQCTLRKETLAYLHEHQKAFVEAMPGFKQEAGWVRWTEPSVEFAPRLKKLFDHTVFQRFDFVTLVS